MGRTHTDSSRSKSTHFLWGVFAVVLTALFWVLSIPPFEFAEAAYIALVPFLLWLKTLPSWRRTFFLSLGLGVMAWLPIIIWLRHVTYAGTIALAVILAFLFALWGLFARLILPWAANVPFVMRVFFWAALAGLWVLMEWARASFVWGFPWAPLALSQWERPVVLQVASWTGAYGISFLLVLFNACVAHTLWVRATVRERKLWSGWFSPDLYAGLFLLLGSIVIFFKTLPRPGSQEVLFRAGVVQPYIQPNLKWDQGRELENMAILERQTEFVGAMEGDCILWPEAATPWPVMGNPSVRVQIEALSTKLQKPILMGNLAFDRGERFWENGVFVVDPESGLRAEYYSKRRLVPFGEYVPVPFAWIAKPFVPLEGFFRPGSEPIVFPMRLGEGAPVTIAPLICYEDIFPALARASVQAGGQVLFVATNNAWYGEEGGAEQHAAHSVLRAVENRRPVMRCGNGGWSGWIDAYGTVREVLRDDRGSVYFRGGGNYTIAHDRNWMRRQSFYTRHGDWFVLVCLGLTVMSFLGVFFRKR